MCHHGGVSVSTDDGLTWSDRTTGIGATQTLKMAAGESDPSYVALGTYHDGTLMTASPWFNLWSPAWKQLQSAFCDGDDFGLKKRASRSVFIDENLTLVSGFSREICRLRYVHPCFKRDS